MAVMAFLLWSEGRAARCLASQRLETFAQRPLSFEANLGQTSAPVQYLAHGPGYTVALAPTQAIVVGQAVLHMQLLGGNPAAQARGVDRLPGRVHYILGKDPSKWRTNIPIFSQVEYQGVYPGIDLVYHGSQQQLEYDFHIVPGADPGQIRLGFPGARSVSVDGAGNLVVQAGGQVLQQHPPVVYQDVAGVRHSVAARFVVDGQEVVFALGNYDHRQHLIIDPVFNYSTFLGGTGRDVGQAIAVDAAGNAYVTGWTSSLNFPTVNPAQPANGGGNYDAFVAKFTPDGSALVYSTYLGGSGNDIAYGIAVDQAGEVYVTGGTQSSDFPTANALQPTYGGGTLGDVVLGDAFVAKLSADGSTLLFSTYLGGSGADEGLGIALDAAGNAYITGQTGSTDFPTANPLQVRLQGFQNVFVAELAADGSALLYSTYLGGSNSDVGYGIAVDAAGDAFVAGSTTSFDFPTVRALQSTFAGGFGAAFVCELAAGGSGLVYSTYLGGSGSDYAFGIALDAAGNAYVTGSTDSSDFPTANALQPAFGGGFQPDAFVAELSADGSALVYSTYLGGSGNDAGNAIAVDASGNAFVTGSTSSIDFPTVNPLQVPPVYGAFVTEVAAGGSALIYSTYLGGRSGALGYGIAVDASGNTLVTGTTASSDFPTVNALQPTRPSPSGNAFVVSIGP